MPRDRIESIRRLLIIVTLLCVPGGCGERPAGQVPDGGAAADRCGDGTCGVSETAGVCPADCSETAQVDVLFVVDNSASMAREQQLLRDQFSALEQSIRATGGAVPDLHLGVVSTDLGAGAHAITGCESAAGDSGALLTAHCAQPDSASYLVDGAPQGCGVDRDDDDTCLGYHCPADACKEGSLVTDPATGCPRCRNFQGETLQTVFDCLADLGTSGCGFEQPLEAMRRALGGHPANHGFLRPGSLLVVLFVTDEDDCSAREPAALFDPSEQALDSPLGPLTSFRCFEQAVVCDENDRSVPGTRVGCRLREGADSLLVSVGEYVDFLRGLRDPGRLVVAGVAGPWDGATAEVVHDGEGLPQVAPACMAEDGVVTPGFRLSSFVQQVHPPGSLPPWAFRSACAAESFEVVLSQVGARVTAALR